MAVPSSLCIIDASISNGRQDWMAGKHSDNVSGIYHPGLGEIHTASGSCIIDVSIGVELIYQLTCRWRCSDLNDGAGGARRTLIHQ